MHHHHDIDDKRFMVHNRKEVARILSDLAGQKMKLNASWNYGQDRTLTSVIDVDYEQGVAYLDTVVDEVANRGLLASRGTVFSSTEGLKIQWSSPSISSVSLKSGKAFRIDLPTDLIRVQRRETYRPAIPKMTPVICAIPLEGQTVEVMLADISSGGVGVTVMEPLAEVFASGTEFYGCHIDFPGIGAAEVTLRIKWTSPVTTATGTVAKHKVGLEFIKPSRGNEALIQRYMLKLEREFAAIAKAR